MTCPPFPATPIRGRVLIVEEPSVYREMQSLLLHQAGYQTVTCGDFASALSCLAKRQIQALVLNISLPGSSVVEFLRTLRQERPALLVLHISDDVTSEVAMATRQLGISASLQRPVGPDQLVRKLDQLLGLVVSPAAPAYFAEPPAPPFVQRTNHAGGTRTTSLRFPGADLPDGFTYTSQLHRAS